VENVIALTSIRSVTLQFIFKKERTLHLYFNIAYATLVFRYRKNRSEQKRLEVTE
jgi:hypothetical protein